MAVEKTPQGFLRFKSRFARHGIQEYGAGEMRRWGVPVADGVPDDAIIRVYRSPEEVFSDRSMKSFENLPITSGHQGTINPDNFGKFAIGMSLAPVVKGKAGRHTNVDILLTRSDGIAEYKRGVKELSGGYSSNLHLDGGMTPEGEPFDYSQHDITGNHIALVPRGRAGTARLLDVRDNQEEDEMSEKVHQDAVELGKVRQQLEDANKEIAKLTAERDELKGRVDTLEAEKLTDEQLAEKVAAGVADARDAEKTRDAVIARAKLFAPQLKVSDDMSNVDIMKVAIKARDSKAEFGDDSEGYIRGRFEALQAPTKTEIKTKTNDGVTHNGEGSYRYEDINSVLG